MVVCTDNYACGSSRSITTNNSTSPHPHLFPLHRHTHQLCAQKPRILLSAPSLALRDKCNDHPVGRTWEPAMSEDAINVGRSLTRTGRDSRKRTTDKTQVWWNSPSYDLIACGKSQLHRTCVSCSWSCHSVLSGTETYFDKWNVSHLLALKRTNGAFNKSAIHWPERRKRSARNACAPFSGRTNCEVAQVGVSV